MAATKQNPSTNVDRFQGVEGKKRLLAAVTEQFMVGGDSALAAKILKKAAIKTVAAGETLMEQGGEDTHLVMILAGSTHVLVNRRVVATRVPGQHIGEMALIDSLARRSATVKAVEATTVAEISEYDFTKLAERNSKLWRRLALCLGDRLRERSKFHPPPRERPAVFIASSTEGLRIGECIHTALRRSNVVPRLWSQGVFEAGKTTIEDLIRAASESDFAVIVTSKDDITISRSKKKTSPRDNVIFELGLFMGALSRERTFVLAPKQVDFKIPSDLLGMTLIPYADRKNSRVSTLMKQPLKIIRTQINKYGPK
jgi:CRP/FNR family transcriptional regulator, cyclic AMP receptor protein